MNIPIIIDMSSSLESLFGQIPGDGGGGPPPPPKNYMNLLKMKKNTRLMENLNF